MFFRVLRFYSDTVVWSEHTVDIRAYIVGKISKMVAIFLRSNNKLKSFSTELKHLILMSPPPFVLVWIRPWVH